MTPRQLTRALVAMLVVLAVSNFAGAQPAGVKRAEIRRAEIEPAKLKPGDKATLAVELEIKPGFHAQSRTPSQEFLIKFEAKLDDHPAFRFGEVEYPKGDDHEYATLGKLNVYTGSVTIRVPVEVLPAAPGGEQEITGNLRYQICDDQVCYAPESPKFSVKAIVEAPATQPAIASGPPPVVVESDTADWGLGTALGVAFLAGILFNIVPCVLPVLPIKVLGFAEVAQHDRRKTFVLALVFGLGIVSVFAVLSLFVLVLKTISWGQQFSNPFFAWGIVVVLLALSLWLFGVLNVNLPTSAYAFTPRHDTMLGNYLWGILTAILSTPCTGPMFVPVMGWAALQSEVVGVATMMTVGVGMAFPYVVLSAFPEVARKFPRVGPWAELFKQMLGFILLAFTAYFAASQFTAGAGKWWAIVPVAAMAGLYLMARTVQLSKEARPVAISAVLSVAMVTATTMLALRFTDFPIAGAPVLVDGAPPAGGGTPPPSASSGVVWTPYSDSALDAARKANKLVLVKFTANWCLNCQYVEATVFHDARAIASLRQHDVVTLKADLTEDDAAGWPRLRELSMTGGIPLTAIYAPGYEKPVQITSVYTTDTLVKTLDQLDGTKAVAVR